MSSDIKITCRKMKWSSGQGTGDFNRNFFQRDITKRPEGWEGNLDTIDLFDYLVRDSLSDIEYTFDSYEFSSDKIVGESSNVSFKLNNLHLLPDGRSFSDYFYIYSDDKQYYKYTVEIEKLISNVWTKVYFGILTNEWIKFDDRVQEIISIDVTGFEDEFRKYFEGVSLVDILSLGLYSSMPSYGGLIGNTMSEIPQYADMLSVINANLPNNWFWYGIVNYTADNSSTEQFFMMKIGYMYSEGATPTWQNGSMFNKAGYENFYTQGTNAFQFFTALCNAMGWIWYFKLYSTTGPAKPMIVIQQRSQYLDSILTLDFSKSIGHSINSVEYDIKADIIMIDNGRLDFGTLANSSSTGYDGLEKVLITNEGSFSGYTNLFSMTGFEYYPSGVLPMYISKSFGTKNSIVLNEIQDYFYKFNRVTDFNVYDIVSLARDRVLEVPVINNEKWKSIIDLSYVRRNDTGYWNGVYQGAGTTLNQYDMSYYGNPGECLIRRTYSGGVYYYETYGEYIGTAKFRKNFYKYLRGKAGLICNVKVNQLIYNPNQCVKITGYDSDNATNNALMNNKYYGLLGLKFNLINDTSELKLQRL